MATASMVSFITKKRRDLHIAHLPSYYPEPQRKALNRAPANLASSLFDESAIQELVQAASTSSSLRTQQALLDVASKSASPQRRYMSPPRGIRRYRSRSPPRQNSPKRVRFSRSPPRSTSGPGASSSSSSSSPPKNFVK